jgi:hypothetical protein
LVGATLVQEGAGVESPPAPPQDGWRPHPRAPHLRLVPRSRAGAQNDPLHLDADKSLRNLVSFVSRLGAVRRNSL